MIERDGIRPTQQARYEQLFTGSTSGKIISMK